MPLSLPKSMPVWSFMLPGPILTTSAYDPSADHGGLSSPLRARFRKASTSVYSQDTFTPFLPYPQVRVFGPQLMLLFGKVVNGNFGTRILADRGFQVQP